MHRVRSKPLAPPIAGNGEADEKDHEQEQRRDWQHDGCHLTQHLHVGLQTHMATRLRVHLVDAVGKSR